MARFGAKRRKTFRVRTQAIFGKHGARIGIVSPGVRRAKRRQTKPAVPQVNQYGKAI